MQIQLFLMFLLGVIGMGVCLRRRFRRRETERRERFLRGVRMALTESEPEW